ncbi:XRE family transcriptional regulator [Nonomuraea sp. NPDC049419]|uniref:XRE family transcriptional regulator n=1 Tax=Nonomuraea sp. NPDC049419 TaxID=3155772 RepID=UPI0034284243
MRAHRLARGWTLGEAVLHLQALCEELDVDPPKTDIQQWGQWETREGRIPLPRTVDLLCRLYATDVADLGYAVGGNVPAHPERTRSAPSSTSELDMPPGLLATSNTHGEIPGELLVSTRRLIDRTLASGSVTKAQLDLLNERLMWLREQYITTPPQTMIPRLLTELREVQAIARDRQPATTQARLSEMTAMLATLIADSLMKLGDIPEAHAWYGTARAAADDSGNRLLRSRVRTQAAMLPYYYGPIEAAVDLAKEASELSAGRAPTITAAFAAMAEARAQARIGNTAAALHALHKAQDVYSRTGPGNQDDYDAFGFPERRLLLYMSGVFTNLGQRAKARAAQQRALELYGDDACIDPALLRIEEAICFAQGHSLDEACQLAMTAYLSVPAGHRTRILDVRARDVIVAIPARLRTARPARELNEVLALPPAEV